MDNYLPVGEATTGSKTSESLQGETAKDVRHMNINSVETSSSEGKCHLGVAVDTLLSENGNCEKLAFNLVYETLENFTSWLLDQALEADHSRHADISGIKLKLVVQTRILIVLNSIELRVGTVGVVSQLLHLVRSAGPPLLDLGTLQINDGLGLVLDEKRLLAGRTNVADSLEHTVRRTTSGEASLELSLITSADLENGSQFFIEESVEHVAFRFNESIK